MRLEDLADFIQCYNPAHRHARKETWHVEKNPDCRWRKYTYAEIIARDKPVSISLGSKDL
jgi:type I restriction enzyme M protein